MDIFRGDAGDFAKGFVREESLVRGDEDVWEGKEHGKFIVEEDLARKIFEEDAFFFLINIERDTPELATLESVQQRSGIDEFAAAGVDDVCAFLHLTDPFFVQQMHGFRGERKVQGNNVAADEQIRERNILDGLLRSPIRGWIRIEGEDFRAEPFEDFSGDFADFPGAHKPHSFAVEIETNEAVQREVVFANAIVGAVNFAIESEQEADGVFGNGVG